MKEKNTDLLLAHSDAARSKFTEPISEWKNAMKIISKKVMGLTFYLLLAGLVFVFIYPFLYMLVTSLKTNMDLNDLTVNWIPRKLKYQNYIISYKALAYGRYIRNSLTVTGVATIGHLLACSFVGYGFARYNFPGKKAIFLLVIIAMIVPIQTLIIPSYILYSRVKWLNSYLPLIIPTICGFGLKGALFIFIFRQFYLGLPKELENAAKIDGCGFLRTYWSIVLPIAQSAFLVTVVLSIVWHWNDFYEPSIYITKPALGMLPTRLSALVALVNNPPEELFMQADVGDGENTINNAVLMAGTFMVVLPVMLSFTFLQRKFMQGIERTGLTGE